MEGGRLLTPAFGAEPPKEEGTGGGISTLPEARTLCMALGPRPKPPLDGCPDSQEDNEAVVGACVVEYPEIARWGAALASGQERAAPCRPARPAQPEQPPNRFAAGCPAGAGTRHLES